MNSPRPTGTITFLFTDIEGSTRLWQAQPIMMTQAMRRHDELLREVLVEHEGYIFKTVGDAFCCAFHIAQQAIAAALAAQRALAAEPWPAETGALRVRMALHTGTADEREGDYFGTTLNRVARLLAAGHGGQVLLSAVTAALVHDDLPPAVKIVGLGQHRLKDLVEEETIFQLVAGDLPRDFPPLRTLDAGHNNLPFQATSLIGRRLEVDEIMDLLRDPGVRLVTLTGIGGTGKTRLALQVAAEQADEYEHGVHFVDLSPIIAPEGVAPAITNVLGIATRGQENPLESLKKYLGTRQLLLVLDNFEQVIGAAPLATDLLAAASKLKILVTSRELLRVTGEYEYAVPPLTLPDLSHSLTPNEALGYESVALFVERVKANRRDFVLDEQNARAVAEICVRLDGLPLAIELAAARVRLFSPQALLARLDHRLRVLGDGPRNAPARQRTLRAMIDWSYDLLDDPEKMLFCRLSVFNGGWNLDAAETICCEGMSIDVFEGLESLLNKSLIRRAPGTPESPRFTMLETIHEYAAASLEISGESEEMRRRHADYFLELGIAGGDELRGFNQLEWLNRLNLEWDNLLAALVYYLDGADKEKGLLLTAKLRDFWLYSYRHVEGEVWIAHAIAMKDDVPKRVRADLLITAGMMAIYRSKAAEAARYFDEAIAIALQENDPRLLAWAKIWWSMVMFGRDNPNFPLALQRVREANEVFRIIDYLPGLSQGMNIYGELLRSAGELKEAEAIYREIIPLALRIGDYRRVIFQYANLCMIAYVRRDPSTMLHYARLGFPLSLEYRVEEAVALFLIVTATVAAWHGRHLSGALLIGAADAWYDDTSVKVQSTDIENELDMKMEVRRTMDESDYRREWNAGRAMTLRAAVEMAEEEITILNELRAADGLSNVSASQLPADD